jgi:hypothetical protein
MKQQYETTILCPFCLNHRIEGNPGTIACPECNAEFETDDRGECVFVDIGNPRMPINGTACMGCGLVQSAENEACTYCGKTLSATTQ